MLKASVMALAACALLLSGCGQEGNEAQSRYAARIETGGPARDFLALDMEGAEFRLSGHKGKVVLLYFWRMKCDPCKKELEALDSLHRAHKDRGLVVVAIGADSMHSAPLAKVREFIDSRGFGFVNIRDEDGYVAEAYMAMRAPEAYIIGRDGSIALAHNGERDWAGPDTGSLIEKLLSEGI